METADFGAKLQASKQNCQLFSFERLTARESIFIEVRVKSAVSIQNGVNQMLKIIYALLTVILGGGSVGIALIRIGQRSDDFSQPTVLICGAFVFAALALLRKEATQN